MSIAGYSVLIDFSNCVLRIDHERYFNPQQVKSTAKDVMAKNLVLKVTDMVQEQGPSRTHSDSTAPVYDERPSSLFFGYKAFRCANCPSDNENILQSAKLFF